MKASQVTAGDSIYAVSEVSMRVNVDWLQLWIRLAVVVLAISVSIIARGLLCLAGRECGTVIYPIHTGAWYMRDETPRGEAAWKRNKKVAVSVVMICSPTRGTLEGAMHHGL